jgi:hypothetical protein
MAAKPFENQTIHPVSEGYLSWNVLKIKGYKNIFIL